MINFKRSTPRSHLILLFNLSQIWDTVLLFFLEICMGHSSWKKAIQVAEEANVKNLYLTHFDPDLDDTFITQVEKECQKRFKKCF